MRSLFPRSLTQQGVLSSSVIVFVPIFLLMPAQLNLPAIRSWPISAAPTIPEIAFEYPKAWQCGRSFRHSTHSFDPLQMHWRSWPQWGSPPSFYPGAHESAELLHNRPSPASGHPSRSGHTGRQKPHQPFQRRPFRFTRYPPQSPLLQEASMRSPDSVRYPRLPEASFQ